MPPRRYKPRPITRVDAKALSQSIEADALRSNATTNLAVWRLRRGMTQKQLAEAAGMSIAALRRIERNEAGTAPRITELANLAIVLGVDATDLLEESWLDWYPTPAARKAPKDPRDLWRRAPGATPDAPRA